MIREGEKSWAQQSAPGDVLCASASLSVCLSAGSLLILERHEVRVREHREEEIERNEKRINTGGGGK